MCRTLGHCAAPVTSEQLVADVYENAKRLQSFSNTSPEATLAKMFRQDLGVAIDPQALRMFIRSRWDRVSPLAHKIHEAL